jgi:acyl carrier protein
MEDEFGLEIDDEEAQNLRTVNDAIKYIESRQAA